MSIQTITNHLIDFENGELTAEEEIEFVQLLVDSGLAWQLQGHYGRIANDFIEAGLVFEPTDEVLDSVTPIVPARRVS